MKSHSGVQRAGADNLVAAVSWPVRLPRRAAPIRLARIARPPRRPDPYRSEYLSRVDPDNYLQPDGLANRRICKNFRTAYKKGSARNIAGLTVPHEAIPGWRS